jgi:hypothetical protein
MTLPFKGSYRQTQGFGGNKEAYVKYGLNGHNGLDHAVPCGTPLYAMISGTVKEVADEGNIGYGKYVKIENDKEGSLVAHLSSFSVKVGDQVKEGETLIGKSGTSGNSTGCHTHTGYYTFPRNRSNGYAGYIDPTPYLNKGGVDMNELDKLREERDHNWNLYVNQQEEARKERVERDKNWRLYQDALAKIKELEARPTTNPKAEALYKAVREATK